MTIKKYIEDILEDFDIYLQGAADITELEELNYKSIKSPDYKNINIQRLYLLRHVFANAFEYKIIYEELFKRMTYATDINAVSAGCGTMIDYWALTEALRKCGYGTCKVQYKGLDKIEWHYKFDFRKGDNAEFRCCNAAEIFEKTERLVADVYFFPKSLCEFDPVNFSCICNSFRHKEIEKEVFHILVSLRPGSCSQASEKERTKMLVDAITANDFVTDDKYDEYITFDAKGKTIQGCDNNFEYPQEALALLERLRERWLEDIPEGEEEVSCDDSLSLLPVLIPESMQYQILTFKRNV